ncbi:unnamed protein product [Phytophthora fragariaefolia]|uniref:Unnamed protein product n=1 Tax=Phytophthora fragariaefolia TaxID=1490495 RepID=A0A9W6X1N1_9STRA|nr:unnamed protein product [Phytophthora fragariaefolia]
MGRFHSNECKRSSGFTENDAAGTRHSCFLLVLGSSYRYSQIGGKAQTMDNGNMTRASALPLRPLLTDSSLTDQDRCQLRYMERKLLESIGEHSEELADLTSNKFDAATDDLNDMYKHVCYPREALLDGLCLDELESAVEKQSKSLSRTDITKVYLYLD